MCVILIILKRLWTPAAGPLAEFLLFYLHFVIQPLFTEFTSIVEFPPFVVRPIYV